MRWLSALMPRETRFFALFDRHGALIVEGANASSSWSSIMAIRSAALN
jgi:hypothetical protein